MKKATGLLLQLLNSFNCLFIYFRYFFHRFRNSRLFSGSVSQKLCQIPAHLIQTVKRKILADTLQCMCPAERIFEVLILQSLLQL